jgi:2-C-methyl-D-erythritol 4-phosphate cytidylyltransferase
MYTMGLHDIPVIDNAPASLAAASFGQTMTTLTSKAYNVKENDTVFVHTIAGVMSLLHAQLVKRRVLL